MEERQEFSYWMNYILKRMNWKNRSLKEISDHQEWRENLKDQQIARMGIRVTLAHPMLIRKSFQIEFSLQRKCIIQESEQSKTTFGNSRMWNVYHLLYWKGLSEAIFQENEKWIQKEDREPKQQKKK